MGCYDVSLRALPNGRTCRPCRLFAYVSDGNVFLTGILQNLSQDTVFLELKVHLSFVGLDLDQDITRSQGVTGLLLPRTNVTGLHRRGEGGHADDGVRREG